MPAIEATRFSLLLREAFGLKEASGQSILEDIFPVYPLEDATAPENMRARGNRLFSIGGTQSLVVGGNPAVLYVGLPSPGAASGPTQPPLISVITQLTIGQNRTD